MDITSLVEQINETAPAYRVSSLQQLRGELHGKRPPTSKIFTTPPYSLEEVRQLLHRYRRNANPAD